MVSFLAPMSLPIGVEARSREELPHMAGSPPASYPLDESIRGVWRLGSSIPTWRLHRRYVHRHLVLNERTGEALPLIALPTPGRFELMANDTGELDLVK